MPVIVKSPHHQPVFLDECAFRCPNRIVLPHSLGDFQMIVKSGLMRDDQVLSLFRGPLQHIQRGHMVTAMPATGVSGFPAFNVSTVSEFHATPKFFWMAA